MVVEADRLVEAVWMEAGDRARDVLAHDQPALDVERHAIRLERRLHHQLHPARLAPPEARVAGDVAEVQALLGDAPDRTLAEHVAGADLGQSSSRADQRLEVGPIRLDDRHATPPFAPASIPQDRTSTKPYTIDETLDRRRLPTKTGAAVLWKVRTVETYRWGVRSPPMGVQSQLANWIRLNQSGSTTSPDCSRLVRSFRHSDMSPLNS